MQNNYELCMANFQHFQTCQFDSPPPTNCALSQFMFWPHLIAQCLAPGLSLSYQSPSHLLPVNAHHLHNPLTSSHKPTCEQSHPWVEPSKCWANRGALLSLGPPIEGRTPKLGVIVESQYCGSNEIG